LPPDLGVAKLLPLINMSSKRPAASIGNPSSRPPTQQFQLSPVLPSSSITRPPIYGTPRTSQQAGFFATGKLNEILNNPVAAKKHDNKEV